MNLKSEDSRPSDDDRLPYKFFAPEKKSSAESNFSYDDNFDSVFDETSPEKTKPKAKEDEKKKDKLAIFKWRGTF